ncbi:MAG: hydroxymethylbilane synthase [Coriobacteriales bacterium]|jgi:hydroxymethylbilane synthase|nr:hydroxymethylbilane synthase [Coriobacteriales bacterium]
MARTIRIGSRESVLAVRQAQIVIDAVQSTEADIQFELVTIRTAGDRNLDKSLSSIGGKGLFVKELEQALLDGSIDIAVHSYKDLPYEENPELPIVALSAREAPYDALVLPDGVSEIDPARPIGSSSLRRSIQLKALYPELETQPVRGNVITRLAKLDLGEYSALVLAQAGLVRLGLANRISKVFNADEMIPSGSQGILAVQSRAGENCSYLAAFHSWESEVVSLAERQYLRTLASDCSAPVAVFAQLQGDQLEVRGMLVDSLGRVFSGSLSGLAVQALNLGATLAAQLTERSQG